MILGFLLGLVTSWAISLVVLLLVVVRTCDELGHYAPDDNGTEIAVKRLGAMTFADVGGVEYLRALHGEMVQAAGDRIVQEWWAGTEMQDGTE